MMYLSPRGSLTVCLFLERMLFMLLSTCIRKSCRAQTTCMLASSKSIGMSSGRMWCSLLWRFWMRVWIYLHQSHSHITCRKNKYLMGMAHFRPITICNVLYEIIPKVLSNHLQKVMNSVIHEAQSAFLSRRLINHNAIIVFEIFHSISGRSSKTATQWP